MTTYIRGLGFGLPRVGYPDPNDPADTTTTTHGHGGGDGTTPAPRGRGPIIIVPIRQPQPPMPTIQPPVPTTITDYGCPDGSRVPDPSMCSNAATSTTPTGSGGDGAPITFVPPAMVIGISPMGKFAIVGLGLLAGIIGATVVIHHHNRESSAR